MASCDYGSDDDEAVPIREIPQLSIADKDIAIDSVELLIIAFGKTPAAALKVRVLDDKTKDWNVYGKVTTSPAPRDSIAATQSQVFCSTHQKAVICLCDTTFPLSDAAPWNALLFKQFNPKTVLIMNEQGKVEFNGANPMETKPIIRRLSSHIESQSDSVAAVQTLEAPNVVGGPAAAALSKCQLYQIPALMLIVYRDASVDMAAVQAFDPAFEFAASNCSVTAKPTAEVAEELKAFIKNAWNNNRGDSLIYL